MDEKRKLTLEKRNKTLSERSISDHIIHIVELPFLGVTYLTALPVEDEHYSKLRCILYPIPGLMFMWFIIMKSRFDFGSMLTMEAELNMFLLFLAPVPIGFILSLLAFFFLPDKSPPKPLSLLFCVLGVVSGLMWSYLLIGTLIDILSVIGVALNLEEAYLGLTILAIGNALPDALTTIALIKAGAGTMAISGGYAG